VGSSGLSIGSPSEFSSGLSLGLLFLGLSSEAVISGCPLRLSSGGCDLSFCMFYLDECRVVVKDSFCISGMQRDSLP
jgi:hypothetical protein